MKRIFYPRIPPPSRARFVSSRAVSYANHVCASLSDRCGTEIARERQTLGNRIATEAKERAISDFLSRPLFRLPRANRQIPLAVRSRVSIRFAPHVCRVKFVKILPVRRKFLVTTVIVVIADQSRSQSLPTLTRAQCVILERRTFSALIVFKTFFFTCI